MIKPIQLSERMMCNAELVSSGNRLADVGTDHAYLPIYLLQTGKIPSAIAMDIKEGPLQRAREHIERFHLQDKIETRLSDGLCELLPDEAESVVIAGMGGMLVIQILKEAFARSFYPKELILQPQSDLPKVRTFLYHTGYRIIKETLLYEDGKVYFPMKAIYTGITGEIDAFHAYIGVGLSEEQHPLLRKWLVQEKKKLHHIKNALRDSNNKEQRLQREEELYQKLLYIEKAEKYLEKTE